MDWKLKIGYDDYLVLECLTTGDYCAREVLLKDKMETINLLKKDVRNKIDLVHELELAAEERNDDPEAVGALYRERWRLMAEMEKLKDEWRQVFHEWKKESHINQLGRDYYYTRDKNRFLTYQTKEK